MFSFLVTSVAKLANWRIQDPSIIFQILIELNMSFGAIDFGGFGLKGASGIFRSVGDWGGIWNSVFSGDLVSRMLSGLLFVLGVYWMFSGISSLLTCFFSSFSTL